MPLVSSVPYRRQCKCVLAIRLAGSGDQSKPSVSEEVLKEHCTPPFHTTHSLIRFHCMLERERERERERRRELLLGQPVTQAVGEREWMPSYIGTVREWQKRPQRPRGSGGMHSFAGDAQFISTASADWHWLVDIMNDHTVCVLKSHLGESLHQSICCQWKAAAQPFSHFWTPLIWNAPPFCCSAVSKWTVFRLKSGSSGDNKSVTMLLLLFSLIMQ